MNLLSFFHIQLRSEIIQVSNILTCFFCHDFLYCYALYEYLSIRSSWLKELINTEPFIYLDLASHLTTNRLSIDIEYNTSGQHTHKIAIHIVHYEHHVRTTHPCLSINCSYIFLCWKNSKSSRSNARGII